MLRSDILLVRAGGDASTGLGNESFDDVAEAKEIGEAIDSAV
jgi:hypothetical protein